MRKKSVKNLDALKVATICVEELGLASPHHDIKSAAKRISGALRSRDIKVASDALASVDLVDHDPLRSFEIAQLGGFIKKLEGPGYDPSANAKQRWETAERKCKWVNRRFRARRRRDAASRPYYAWIHRMKEFILSVLGEEPPLDDILDLCGFGPGTSVGVRGDATHFFSKLKGEWSITPTCLPYAAAALSRVNAVQSLLGFERDGVRCIDPKGFYDAVEKRACWEEKHDEVMMVPKNAKTHRFIGKPKTLDGFVQTGVGEHIARRLRLFGCDLRDQTRNQRLAYEGSLGWNAAKHPAGPWSTIDLEMASDTLSFEVVKELLPRPWFNLLLRLRSPSYTMVDFPNEGVRNYEKFSAMGNGFTFPLETLVFMAACHAAGDGAPHTEFSVYGDDIIIRQGHALATIELLSYIGFRTNVEKTFLFGSFRESCGADYSDGLNIRPSYIKGSTVNNLQLIGLHNRIVRSEFFVYTALADRLRRLGSDIPTKPHHPFNVGGAFMVPYDVWVKSADAVWDDSYQTHVWREFVTYSVFDVNGSEGLPPGSLIGGAIHGGIAREGTPYFAYRRRTKVRRVLLGSKHCGDRIPREPDNLVVAL